MAILLGHLSQSSGLRRLHPESYEQPNPSAEAPNLAETVPLTKTLPIEVQRNAPACPDKQQQL